MPTPFLSHRTVLASAKRTGVALAAALALTAGIPVAASESASEVTQLSLEDLMNIEVTTVSRKAQKLTDTAAAAFVVTADDIRRSGATSLPEALRMVPGVEVARIGSSRWAVTARGFNSRFANKLLVLIDGRSVYSPLFSGVFWEAEDVMLEDIDRIEVIRGSGAALWGANAVNGIINIVTRSARRTQGGLVSALAGHEERGQLGARQGLMVDDDTSLRLWAKAGKRQRVLDLDENRSGYDWTYARAGFRLDRDGARGAHLTLLGNVQDGDSGETLIVPTLVPPYASLLPNPQNNQGANLLGRYEFNLPQGDPASLQAYLDHSLVNFRDQLRDQQTTLDLDFQSRKVLGQTQDLVWGLGFRQTADQIDSGAGIIRIDPRDGAYRLFSAFAHDEVTVLPDTWKVILGTKLEHNSYTGFEWQPNLRTVWTPDPRHTVWAAVSRAVRTPSRAERDASIVLQTTPPSAETMGLPVLENFLPNANLKSESVISTELGYRTQIGQRMSADLAAFHSHYRDLRSGRFVGITPVLDAPIPYLRADSTTSNTMSANATGMEVSLDWHVLPQWRLQAGYTHLLLKARRNGDPANDVPAAQAEGNSPRNQVSLRSSLDLLRNQEFDLSVKHVSSRPEVSLAAYTELDLRYAWHVTPGLELSLVGQNLLGTHAESGSDPLPSQPLQVPRGGYVQVRWQF